MKIFRYLVFLLSCPLFGQATTGAHRVNQVIARGNSGLTAQVVPGARVFVTLTSSGAAATIYYDPSLSFAIPGSVVTTDPNGNYNYYFALNTCLTETTSAPGQGNIVTPNICSTGGGTSNGITALTSDVLASGPGSAAATVVGIHGGSIPISAACIGTNSSGQLFSTSCGGGTGAILSAPSASQAITQPTGTSFSVSEANTTNNSNIFLQNSYQSYAPGWNNGISYNGNSDWNVQTFQSSNAGFMSATAGISQFRSCLFTHTAGGDTQCQYDYLSAFGDLVNGNDEGVAHTQAHIQQIGEFYGPITNVSSSANATNLLTVTGPSCTGPCSTLAYYSSQFPVGGWMVNQTSGVTGPYTVSTYTPNVNGANLYALSSGTVTPSTAYGTVAASTTSVQGKIGVYGPQTVTINVLGGTNVAGFTTGSDVCRVGIKEEEDTVTSVGALSGSTQTIVLQSQYPFYSGDYIAQGGPCGRVLGAYGSSVSTVDFVAGASDSTHISFGHCNKQGCGTGGNVIHPNTVTAQTNLSRSGGVVTATPYPFNFSSLIYLPVGSTIIVTGASPSDLNGTFTISSTTGNAFNEVITWSQSGATETSSSPGTISLPLPQINLYESGQICGTNNGTVGQANICTNSVSWNTGDVIVGAASAEFSMTGITFYMNQYTPMDASYPSTGITINNIGQTIQYAYGAIGNYSSPFYASAGYLNLISSVNRPSNNGAVIAVQGVGSSIPYYLFQDGSSYASILVDPSADRFTFGSQGAGSLTASSLALPSGGSASNCWHTDGSNGVCRLTGTTGTITGTTLSSSCDSGTATVTGATIGHPVYVSSTTGADVGGAFNVRASVTATNTITVYVCGTGTPSSLAFNVATY